VRRWVAVEARGELGRIRVRGVGEVSVEPDLLQAEIGVVAEDKKLEGAQEKQRQQLARVLSALRAHGVERSDHRTVSFQVAPVYEPRVAPESRVARPIGHRVEQVLGLCLRDLKRAGRILDAVVEAGANRVYSVRFGLSEEGRWRRKALRLAVKEAWEKARAAASALGREPIALESLEEEVAEFPRPIQTLTVGTETPETVLEPGMLTIRAEVRAVFLVPGRLSNS